MTAHDDGLGPTENQTRHVLADDGLAEDNPANQKVAKGILEKFGFKVDVVGNGLKALAAMQENSYDLILMDCWMPASSPFSPSTTGNSPKPYKTKGAGPNVKRLNTLLS